MDDKFEDGSVTQWADAERPLLGLTVMTVDDSRYASEAIRLLCLRSGARVRRADTLRSARRHLSTYRPAVAIIVLGMPDGSGADLIGELSSSKTRLATILGTSGDAGCEQQALHAGADGFLEKPIESLATFQHKILTHLRSDKYADGLHLLANDFIHPEPLALHDDLSYISEVLTTSDMDDKSIAYITLFLIGVARIARDYPLVIAATDLETQRRSGRPVTALIVRLAGLVHQRLQEQPTP